MNTHCLSQQAGEQCPTLDALVLFCALRISNCPRECHDYWLNWSSNVIYCIRTPLAVDTVFLSTACSFHTQYGWSASGKTSQNLTELHHNLQSLRLARWSQVAELSHVPGSWNAVDVDNTADKTEVKHQAFQDDSFCGHI